MTQRIRFIERMRNLLHINVDNIIDSIYRPNYTESKSSIQSMKIELDKLQNQIKKDG